VTAKIIDALTKAVDVVKGILLRLKKRYAQSSPLVTTALNEAAPTLSQITADLKEHETAITVAADYWATMPSLLRRLAKKCKQHCQRKPTIRNWWENAQDLLSDETEEARRKHRAALLEELENNWDLPNWLPNVAQCVSQYGHALANTQSLPKPLRRGKMCQHGGTTYIDMQKVGCALIQDVRGTLQSLPAGSTRRDPAPTSHLTLIILAELLKDLSRPVNREDLDEVGSDLRRILASEGDLAKRNSFSHSRFFRKQKVCRGKFSPLMSLDEAFGEWEARTGDCRPPALVRLGRGCCHRTSSHRSSAPRSLEQTQATKTWQTRPVIAISLAVP